MTNTIVYFVDSFAYGGSEQALLHLLTGLDRRRWQPVLFHHAEPGIAPLIEKARRLNVPTRVVPVLKGRRAISGLPRFLWQLSQEKPALLHAYQNWLLSCKYGILAAALARVPVIATAQQFMEPPWGKSIAVQQQILTRCVDRYIAVSNAVGQQLSGPFRVPARKVRVIPNSVPANHTRPLPRSALRSQLGLRVDCPVVLTVARLDTQKGHTYLFEAFRQVPEAVLVLAGDGPERNALEALADKLCIRERVYFLGHRNDIPDLLACSDLFVLPSIYEGLPLAILEAMDAGRAVVSTAVGGTPELVRDGETGFLVPSRDPAALAYAIQRLLSDPKLALRMGLAGKALVKQDFSVNTMVQHIMQVYEDLLRSPETRAGSGALNR